MGEPRSAQRYLEDLTPGGSEYFNNPKRCYEWAQGRIEAAHSIARDAALERNRLRDEVKRLDEQLRIATAALDAIAYHHPYDAATVVDDALIQMSVVE